MMSFSRISRHSWFSPWGSMIRKKMIVVLMMSLVVTIDSALGQGRMLSSGRLQIKLPGSVVMMGASG